MKRRVRFGLLVILLGSCGDGNSQQDQGPPPEDSRFSIEGLPRGDGGRGKEGGNPERATVDSGGGKSVTIVMVGDVVEPGRTAYARANADLISKHSPAVSAVILGGDNARFNGALSLMNLFQFYNTYYRPAAEGNWGQFDPIAFPQLGNHEYSFPEISAQGYFDYFKPRMGAIKLLPGYAGFVDVVGKAYYSFDINGWHFVSLNSNCGAAGGCGPGSPQESWLKADLAKNGTKPIVGVWHHPRYTCGGSHGNDTEVQALWADLYDAGADFVFNGHNHYYQRWKPLNKADPQAAIDASKGLTEVVAGSCGVSTYSVCGTVDPRVEKQIGGDSGMGVFFLNINTNGNYSFEYRLKDGTVFDSGSGVSHHHP